MLSKLISATKSSSSERISSVEQTNTRRRERELARVFAERDFRWVPKILCEVVHVITLRATKINKGPIWWHNEREGKKTSRGKELARRKSYQQSCAADDKNSISICFLLSSQDGPDFLSSQNGNDRFRAGLPTLNVQLKAVNFEPMLWRLEWKTIHEIGGMRKS